MQHGARVVVCSPRAPISKNLRLVYIHFRLFFSARRSVSHAVRSVIAPRTERVRATCQMPACDGQPLRSDCDHPPCSIGLPPVLSESLAIELRGAVVASVACHSTSPPSCQATAASRRADALHRNLPLIGYQAPARNPLVQCLYRPRPSTQRPKPRQPDTPRRSHGAIDLPRRQFSRLPPRALASSGELATETHSTDRCCGCGPLLLAKSGIVLCRICWSTCHNPHVGQSHLLG